MRRCSWQEELEEIRLRDEWHRNTLKDRAKGIHKVKCKKRVKKLKKWLKNHIN